MNYGGTRTVDIVANDENASNYTIEILSGPTNGILSNVDIGKFEYAAPINFVGQDVALYEICSNDTECDCSQASIYFNVGMNVEDCDPPSIITPNGDNKNESFSIGCVADVTKHPNNELVIFNRWGDEVFRQSPYLNEWKGTYNGQDLPDGTYFYILDLNSGDNPISGYLIIQR